MAIRVTPERVRAVAKVSEATDVEDSILSANMLVDSCAEKDNRLSEERLTLIELWLSAHYVAVINPKVSSKSALGASSSYSNGPLDKGFESTSFGQQALLLDTSGYLRSLDNEEVCIRYLGETDAV